AIGAVFHGTEGAVELCNVEGSFFDFEAFLNRGTGRRQLVGPPDEWGPRAILDWVDKLGSGTGFDPGIEDVVAVADTLDRIYGR
ncbi:MAG: gfo/Idh/MocA family oxidoreductase, partial [Chloroflexi bacterium]|nr:gfo/Idh/MocA family oxidoreductase [Chloroflexota bacterium]